MRTNDQLSENLLTGLIFACPLGQSTSNCPFAALRAISVERRLEIIDHYTISQQERILRHHRNCLCKHDIFTSHINTSKSTSSVNLTERAAV